MKQWCNYGDCGRSACETCFPSSRPIAGVVQTIEHSDSDHDPSSCAVCSTILVAAAKAVAGGDMKEALVGAVSKPDLTHCRRAAMVYEARAKEYGADKYERANYLRRMSSPAADFSRFRSYLRAAVSHFMFTLDAMEAHEANDPQLVDVEGMRRAMYAADTDPGLNFPASGLPHVSHGLTSTTMAITQAVDAGMLPADPGQPWREQ